MRRARFAQNLSLLAAARKVCGADRDRGVAALHLRNINVAAGKMTDPSCSITSA
jgi:hypothetical protein